MQHAQDSDRNRKDGRLGIFCQFEFGFRTGKAEATQRQSQSLLCLYKDSPGGVELVKELFPHAHILGALSGEYEGDLSPFHHSCSLFLLPREPAFHPSSPSSNLSSARSCAAASLPVRRRPPRLFPILPRYGG